MKPVIHASQSPAQVEVDRAECLRRRIIASKFLYESPRQAELWLRLHEQYVAPADLTQTYQQAAEALAACWAHAEGTLIALGCGGGEKDLKILDQLPHGMRFLPTDVSVPLAVKAAPETAALIFDLATAKNLPEFIDQYAGPNRVFTFFGILPNFSPDEILPQLRALLKPEDRLLLSANLAPHGIGAILPQYDNADTREWLSEYPRAHGAGEGVLKITVETDNPHEFISGRFYFREPCIMRANDEQFHFQSGDALHIFVSYRYTLRSLGETLGSHGIVIEKSFQSTNGEEGVFLCGIQ